MEDFQAAIEGAKKRIKIADHILDSTFPLVKDPRLLMGVMENTFLALSNAMSSLLYYERFFKRIDNFKDDFKDKFYIFRYEILNKYRLSRDYLILIQDVKNMVSDHKNSPIEFSKGDRFVICSEGYMCRSVSVDDMKKFISKSKQFIQDVSSIVYKNERIFR